MIKTYPSSSNRFQMSEPALTIEDTVRTRTCQVDWHGDEFDHCGWYSMYMDQSNTGF